MVTKKDTQAALKAFLGLLAATPYHALSLQQVAEASGVPAGRLIAGFGSKAGLVEAYFADIDAVLLAEPVEADGSVRDRLFDVIMRRFDAMQGERAALANLRKAMRKDRCLALRLAPVRLRSARIVLALAGIDPDSRRGHVSLAGLAVILSRTIDVFLADETADLSPTMKALDAHLARADKAMGRLCGLSRWTPCRRRSKDGPTPSPNSGASAAA